MFGGYGRKGTAQTLWWAPNSGLQLQTLSAFLKSTHCNLSTLPIKCVASEVEGDPVLGYLEFYAVLRHMISYYHDSHLLPVNFMQILIDFPKQINNNGQMANICITFTRGWTWGFAHSAPKTPTVTLPGEDCHPHVPGSGHFCFYFTVPKLYQQSSSRRTNIRQMIKFLARPGIRSGGFLGVARLLRQVISSSVLILGLWSHASAPR